MAALPQLYHEDALWYAWPARFRVVKAFQNCPGTGSLKCEKWGWEGGELGHLTGWGLVLPHPKKALMILALETGPTWFGAEIISLSKNFITKMLSKLSGRLKLFHKGVTKALIPFVATSTGMFGKVRAREECIWV